MGMERITVEQNGERFTLEVPEGTTDAEIQSFIGQQQTPTTPNKLTTTEPSLAGPVEGMATGAALKGLTGMPQQTVASAVGPIKPTTTLQPGLATRAVTEVADLVSDIGRVTPKGLAQNIGHPFQTLSGLPGALAERFAGGNYEKPIGEIIKGAGKSLLNPANIKNAAAGVGAMALGPENMFAAPYQMAAYEQEKIRQNPNAPGLETNPYAQMTRGEAATQGQAGAMNRRQAIAGQQYGGLTTQEQQMLQQDRQRQIEIQNKKIKAQQVLQQPPTAQNFIERMTAMADLYGNVNRG